MAGYSSRSDQLWYFAQQLVEEETKFIPFAKQEEHGQIIQGKYDQLVSNLSSLGDIIAAMYEKEKLTPKELEQVQHLLSTPIRANEELLSIIARKPRNVYECFLSIIKDTNQLHLYQMLISDNDTCDKARREDAPNHKDLIRRNFMWLSEKLDTENGLISLLYQQSVLTLREKELFFCMNNTFQQNELLLGLLSKKSAEDFEKFVEALEASGQGHLSKELRKPEGSPTDSATVPSAIPTPKSKCHKLLSKDIDESTRKSIPVRAFSKPVSPKKQYLKSGQKLIPLRSLSKTIPPPKSCTQPTSAQQYSKPVHTVAQRIDKTVNFRRTKGVKFQERLKGLESRLQTDIAIKVTSVFLFYPGKTENSMEMCFRILLQDCRKMRKELVARNVETNMELEQLRKTVCQYSAAATLNEVFRTQLHSMQQELTSEKAQSKKERMHLKEMISNLKTEIQNEKAKEKLLKNALISEMKDRLKKAECDENCYQQQMHELNNRLALNEYELQKSKENFDEINIEMTLLRTEREKLKEAYEILKKENEIRNDLEVQLLHMQENNLDLLSQITEKERSLENVKSHELAEGEKLELNKPQNDAAEDKPQETDRILKLQEELDCEKHQKQELQEKLNNATAQLEELNRMLIGRDITYVNQESRVIRNNHQFLVQSIKSSRLIDILHVQNCITDRERYYFMHQTGNFHQNDALLQWMRTIPFKEHKGRKVLDCFRLAEENFVADLLVKGGVLVKSMISTNLENERQPFSLFAKSSSKNVDGLKEKEAMVIERLNQMQGLKLSSIQSVTSDIPVDDIVIAPYCHQEANGIVIWFWCQSKHGQVNLQRMYESGILLDKLITIFKEFANDSVLPASKLLVPTSITIFVGDFTRDGNGLPDKYISDPHKIGTIRTKAAEEGRPSISGLTILDKVLLFVVSKESAKVELYDSDKFSFINQWNLKELRDPWDIGSCNRNKCLYIFDYKGQNQSKEILRVDPSGKIIKKWSTGVDYGYGLSVTNESNVILTVHNKNKLNEYSPDGQLIRKINLSSKAGILSPWHAIKITNDHFVTSHGYRDHNLHRVCVVDADGKLMKSFGGKRGSNIGQMNLPVSFSVDGNGFLLVVDQGNNRVLLLDSNLEYKREILSEKKHRLQSPWRILLDDSSSRMLVAEDDLGIGGLITIFQL